MAHDSPDLPELVRTAHEFVTSITPRLDGEERYHALCTVYVLEIVLRELKEWRPVVTQDDRRLQELLGDDRELPRDSLVADLSSAIRSGAFDGRMDGLLEELIEHVVSKVNVSKPTYLDDPSD